MSVIIPSDVVKGLVDAVADLSASVERQEQHVAQSQVNELLSRISDIEGMLGNQGKVPLSLDSAVWFFKTCATRLSAALSANVENWEEIGAAWSYTESGVEILNEAVRSLDQ